MRAALARSCDAMHANWGGFMDLLEHSAYCDGQREEEPEGFFFDNTRPEYDSDCDGDPFSNNYLTEDEYEFPAEYSPAPYIPGRVMDAIWFAYSVKKTPIARLVEQFGMPTHRLTAIINLKATEPAMKASGRYDERIDAQLSDLYANRFGSPGHSEDRMPLPARGYSEPLDLGPKGTMLHDDVEPDEALPPTARARSGSGPGTVLRIGHHGLPRVAAPAKAARVHDSKFVFRDISGRARNNAKLLNPLVTADFDGSARLASNRETLYRSWETRYWTPARASPASSKGWPFADAEEDKPRPADGGYRLPP